MRCRALLTLGIAVVSGAACGGETGNASDADAGGEADAGAWDAAAPQPPPRCGSSADDPNPRVDYTWCSDGRIFEYERVVIPNPLPQCDDEIRLELVEREPCDDGCEYEEVSIFSSAGSLDARKALLCAGTPSRQIGDPCTSEIDCKPNRAQLDSDGELRTTYLGCVSGECAEIEPPRPGGDVGGPCALASAAVDTGEVGFDGVCLIARDADGACLRSGVGVECSFDHDCGPGTFCRPPVVPDVLSSGLCKSGPPGDFSDYSCSCPCNWQQGACDARAGGSTEPCPCDPDCGAGAPACSDDDLCDPRCETAQFTCADPDCVGFIGVCDEPKRGRRAWTTPPSDPPTCECDTTVLACDGPDPTTGGDCRCDPDCY